MVFVWVNLFFLNKPYKDRKCNTMCTMAQRVLMHLKPIFRCFCAVNIPNKAKKDVNKSYILYRYYFEKNNRFTCIVMLKLRLNHNCREKQNFGL